ncbi:hypothetical protein E2C01_078022 [Portunus trituberculatus]|uniref:Uncharacterized protein n=1 Tax=Portunus trituberculatus TaxID=210409 RepID=A0A5B7ILT0_PORTR|nr:hypothetical protein [Portunus trituberculatus]
MAGRGGESSKGRQEGQVRRWRASVE